MLLPVELSMFTVLPVASTVVRLTASTVTERPLVSTTRLPRVEPVLSTSIDKPSVPTVMPSPSAIEIVAILERLSPDPVMLNAAPIPLPKAIWS